MIDEKVLCEKITSIYPEIGVCDIDIDVAFSKKKNAWVVDLSKDDKNLKTHLEISDAERCMEGGKYVPLGIQVAKLARRAKKDMKVE